METKQKPNRKEKLCVGILSIQLVIPKLFSWHAKRPETTCVEFCCRHSSETQRESTRHESGGGAATAVWGLRLLCVTVFVARKTNQGQNCCRNKKVWRGGKRLYVTSFPLRSCFEQVQWVLFFLRSLGSFSPGSQTWGHTGKRQEGGTRREWGWGRLETNDGRNGGTCGNEHRP